MLESEFKSPQREESMGEGEERRLVVPWVGMRLTA